MSELPLPLGWCRTEVSDLIELTSSIDPTRMPSAEISYIDIGAIDSATGRISAPKRLRGSEAPSRARQAVRQGDVLFSTVRPYLRAIALVPALENPVASTGFCVLRPATGIDSHYLYHYLRSDAFVQQVLPLQRGSSYPAVRDQDVLGQSIPVPPAAEQKRVADAIDELFSDIDVGVAELKAAQAKLKQYRQSLLKAAVEGALTAEWRERNPPQETGAELLARILRERRARWEAQQLDRFKADGKTPPKNWQAKYIAPNPASTRSLPALPRGWAVASLDELIYRSNYGTSVKCQYGSQGVAVLRIPNISPGGMSFDDLKFATGELGVVESDYLAPGDILMIRTNGSVGIVGRVGVVPEEGFTEKFYFASYLFRMRPAVGGPLAKWIGRYLSSPQARRVLESMAASSAGQHNISLSATLRLPIPLPPLREQSAAIDMLNDLLVGTDCNEASITHGLRLAAAQRQNILRAAFAGQLVPQDPADEPASALLARIRAERAARAAAPEARRPRKRRETT